MLMTKLLTFHKEKNVQENLQLIETVLQEQMKYYGTREMCLDILARVSPDEDVTMIF